MRNLIKQPKNPRVVHPPRHGVWSVWTRTTTENLFEDDYGYMRNEKLISWLKRHRMLWLSVNIEQLDFTNDTQLKSLKNKPYYSSQTKPNSTSFYVNFVETFCSSLVWCFQSVKYAIYL
jgi:hypothetical protein